MENTAEQLQISFIFNLIIAIILIMSSAIAAKSAAATSTKVAVTAAVTAVAAASSSSSTSASAVKPTSFYQRGPLLIKKLSDKATIPKQGSPLAAGLDLASAVDLTIPPSDRALVKTDLSIACPPGTYARIAPRSGLAYKKGIDVGAGVIDADYRGPVGVILFNFGKEPFEIKTGDRIAQLILEQIIIPDICVVDDLDATERGVGGFGSTGVGSKEPVEVADGEQASNKKQRTVSPTASAGAPQQDPPEKTNNKQDPPDAEGSKN